MKKIFNWKQFNENFGHDDMQHMGGQDDMRNEYCDGCHELHQNCTCEHEHMGDDMEHMGGQDDMRSEWCDDCGEETGRCMCHMEEEDEYNRVPDLGMHEKMNKNFKAFLDKKKTEKEEKEDKKDSKGKTPTTKKEKELAAKYPPKDKITRGDIITAAKEKAKKK